MEYSTVKRVFGPPFLMATLAWPPRLLNLSYLNTSSRWTLRRMSQPKMPFHTFKRWIWYPLNFLQSQRRFWIPSYNVWRTTHFLIRKVNRSLPPPHSSPPWSLWIDQVQLMSENVKPKLTKLVQSLIQFISDFKTWSMNVGILNAKLRNAASLSRFFTSYQLLGKWRILKFSVDIFCGHVDRNIKALQSSHLTSSSVWWKSLARQCQVTLTS